LYVVEAVRDGGELNETPAYHSYKETEVNTSILKHKNKEVLVFG